MATFGYLLVCMAGLVLAVLVAVASHFAHAYLQFFPDKIMDGGRPVDYVLNELMSPNYTPFGRYDDFGRWEFYSLFNLLLHLAPWLIVYGIVTALYWPERAMVVTKTCEVTQVIALTPVFCAG